MNHWFHKEGIGNNLINYHFVPYHRNIAKISMYSFQTSLENIKMDQYMDTRPWQRSDAEYTVSAVLLAVIPGLLILLTIRWYGICLSPFVFLIALLSIIEIQRRIQVKTWKVVFIEQQIAAQVIENVLQNKNIPYQRVNDQFELEDSNLIIHIQYFTGHPPQHFIGIPSRPGDLKTPYT